MNRIRHISLVLIAIPILMLLSFHAVGAERAFEGYAVQDFGSLVLWDVEEPLLSIEPWGGGAWNSKQWNSDPWGGFSCYVRDGGPVMTTSPADHTALGRAPPIVCVVAEATAYGLYNPGGTLVYAVGGGSYDLAANYYAECGIARSMNYDGALDWSKIWENDGAENALDWQAGGIWFEVLFYGDSNLAGSYNGLFNKYYTDGSNHRFGFRVAIYQQTQVVVAFTEYSSGAQHNCQNLIIVPGGINTDKWWLLRVQMTDTHLKSIINNGTLYSDDYAGGSLIPANSANTIPFEIGSFNTGGSGLGLTRVPLVNCYAGEPTVAQRDAYYDRLKAFGIVD